MAEQLTTAEAWKGALGFEHLEVVDISANDFEPDWIIRGVWVKTSGSLVVRMMSGAVVPIPAECLSAGVIYPMFATHLISSGSTAEVLAGY